jgi:hypothetical protein
MGWSVGEPVRVADNAVSLQIENGHARTFSVAAYERDGAPCPIAPTLYPFLPIVISMAAIEGEDVRLKAAIDDGYFVSLSCGLATFASAMFGGRTPVLRRDSQRPPAVLPTRPSASGLLFSAGIDSFYSLKLLMDRGIRLDFLLNINAGAHKTAEMRKLRMANIVAVAEKLGIPVLELHTNFHEVFPLPYAWCSTLLNVAASLALFPDVSTFYFSSASSFQTVSFATAKTYGAHYVDHAQIAYLAPPEARLIPLGFDANRAEKTVAVADFALSHSHLDVCFNGKYQVGAQRVSR